MELTELTRQTAIKAVEQALVRQQSIIKLLVAYIADPPEVGGLRALQILQNLCVVPDENRREDTEVEKAEGKGTGT